MKRASWPVFPDRRAAPLLLPLWSRVVFVDWNGVLNHESFWSSIRANRRHPQHAALSHACGRLFEQEDEIVRLWMRGELASKQVVERLGVTLDRRCRKDFLLRRLRDDCRRMSCESALIAALQEARRECFVVLATDNMDCFADAAFAIKDLVRTVDVILCSSRIGVLKGDGVDRFFGGWLREHRLTFAQAILLDDNPRTCAAFRGAGGTAVVVRSSAEAIQGLEAWRRADVRPCVAGSTGDMGEPLRGE